MKIILIRDRLGNQMFQYALYKELKYRGQDVKMSLEFVENHPEIQEYELGRVFGLKPDMASDEELRECRKRNGGLYGKLRSKLAKRDDFPEIRKGINHDIFLINNIVLNGWWQNEHYFAHVKDELEKEFHFAEFTDEKNLEIKELIEKTDSVGVHVRKTDYLINGRDNYYGSICGSDYYHSVIKRLNDENDNRQYFIFTDDHDWVRKNLKFPQETIFVSHNRGWQSYRDMQLMSICKTLVIANSTFSWWAGWIGEKNGQRIIAPKRWCDDKKKYMNSLSLERWEKI